jgi:hypothetical protein
MINSDSTPAVEKNNSPESKPEKYSWRRFRSGEWVEIRSEAEIRATLDAEGNLDGLPFMPEQVKYCGRKYRIFRRADRVFLDYHYYVVRLKSTVLLDDLRCDGSAHGGCQMKCMMFWKEAWLRPTTPPAEEENGLPPISLVSLTNLGDSKHQPSPPAPLPEGEGGSGIAQPAKIGEKFSCQATELAKIGTRLPGWDLRQYVWDVLNRDRSLGFEIKLLARQAINKLKRIFSRNAESSQLTAVSKPSGAPLNLQPGEWVEVKSFDEIQATLNSFNKLRGLGFAPDQKHFCGKRFRVTGRVERMILEWTGELKKLSDTVALDAAHCDGGLCRACPRNCYFLWREDWLKRVDGPLENS